MTQNKNVVLLKVALAIFAITTFVYGIGYLFFPAAVVDLSGSDPVPSGWLRWPGATLIALSVGAIIVLVKPAMQHALVITFGLGTLFTGLTLLYSWFCDYIGETWFTAVPTIVLLINSALIWWGYARAKEVLKQTKAE